MTEELEKALARKAAEQRDAERARLSVERLAESERLRLEREIGQLKLSILQGRATRHNFVGVYDQRVLHQTLTELEATNTEAGRVVRAATLQQRTATRDILAMEEQEERRKGLYTNVSLPDHPGDLKLILGVVEQERVEQSKAVLDCLL